MQPFKLHGWTVWTVFSDSRLICLEPNDSEYFSQLLKPITPSGGISVASLNYIVSHWNHPYPIRFQNPLLTMLVAYPVSHPWHRSWKLELTWFPLHLPKRKIPTLTARRICKIQNDWQIWQRRRPVRITAVVLVTGDMRQTIFHVEKTGVPTMVATHSDCVHEVQFFGTHFFHNFFLFW